MPYTMEDFRKDFRRNFFKELTPEERKEVVKELTPEERLDGLSAEQLLRHVSRAEIEEQLRRADDRPGAEPTSGATPLP